MDAREEDLNLISNVNIRLPNSRFRKAGSAVSVIFKCEAREPHTPAVLTILPRRFYTRSRPFVRIWSVARVRKKYDCFAVYVNIIVLYRLEFWYRQVMASVIVF